MLATSAVQAGDGWVEVRTPDVHVISNVRASRALSVAGRVADHRLAINALFPAASTHSRAPVPLLLLDDAAWRAYGPFCVEPCSGAAIHSDDRTYLVARGDGDARVTLETVFHELTHRIIYEDMQGIRPAWFHEGVSELFCSVSREKGKLKVGAPPQGTLRVLRSSSWLPLAHVLGVERGADHDMGGPFYAQSWLMVHYTRLENPARFAQLNRYMDLRARGESVDSAIDEAFSGEADELDAELRAYSRRKSFNLVQLELPPSIALTKADARPLTPVEGNTHLAEVLVAMRRVDRPATRLHADLVRLAGTRSTAALLAAVAHEFQHNTGAAQELVDENCSGTFADAETPRLCGDAYALRVSYREGSADADIQEWTLKARAFYYEALRMDSGDIPSLFSLARTYLVFPGEGSGDVRARLEQFVRESPGNSVALMLLGGLVAHEDAQQGKVYLDQALARASTAEQRELIMSALRSIDESIAASHQGAGL